MDGVVHYILHWWWLSGRQNGSSGHSLPLHLLCKMGLFKLISLLHLAWKVWLVTEYQWQFLHTWCHMPAPFPLKKTSNSLSSSDVIVRVDFFTLWRVLSSQPCFWSPRPKIMPHVVHLKMEPKCTAVKCLSQCPCCLNSLSS